MIQTQTKLLLSDNSGGKTMKCIRSLGYQKRNPSYASDMIVSSLLKVLPHKRVKKSQMCNAIIVRTRKKINRRDGTGLAFDNNSAVIVKENYLPVANRINGPVVLELRIKGYTKVVAICSNSM